MNCSKLLVRTMVSENKLQEWAEAVLKILHEGSSDKAVADFVRFVSQKTSMLE